MIQYIVIWNITTYRIVSHHIILHHIISHHIVSQLVFLFDIEMIRPTLQLDYETNDKSTGSILTDINIIARSKYFDDLMKKSTFVPTLRDNYYVNRTLFRLNFDETTLKNIIKILDNNYDFKVVTNDFIKNIKLIDIPNIDYNLLTKKLKRHFIKNCDDEIKCNIVSEIIDCDRIDSDHKIDFFNELIDTFDEKDISMIEQSFNAKKITGKTIEHTIVAKDISSIKNKPIKFDFGNKSYSINYGSSYENKRDRYSCESDRNYHDMINIYRFDILSTEKNYSHNSKNIHQKCLITISEFVDRLKVKDTCVLDLLKCNHQTQFKYSDKEWNNIFNKLQFKIHIVCKSYFKYKNIEKI
jgi:hypothetical protein